MIHHPMASKHLPIFLAVSLLLLFAMLAVGCSSDSSTGAAAAPQPATVTLDPSVAPITTLPETPAPSATSTPKPTSPLPSSRPSGAGLADLALGYATELVEVLGPRESATEEELEAAEHLASTLENLGYAVEMQSFTVQQLSSGPSGLKITAPQARAINAIPLVRSAIGEVSGKLVSVGLAREEDFPVEGMKGQIALAQRGRITFEEKVTLAAEAGAVAVVVYNNLPGDFQGILFNPADIPVVSISREDGREIEDLLSASAVEAAVSVLAEQLPSRNVIAEKSGLGDAVVVLGGHYDTVADTTGANDNASGVAVLLTLAAELAGEDLPFTVRFIAFGSEELGLRGSRHYVASLTETQLDRIRAMFNFDALGSGETLEVLGARELTDLALAQGDAQVISVRVSPPLQGASSDHQSFVDAGIPVLLFVSDDFSRIHTPADTLQFVVPHLLGDAAELALSLLKSDDFLTVLK